MKTVTALLLSFAVLVTQTIVATPVFAATNCTELGYNITAGNPNGQIFAEGDPSNKIDLTVSGTSATNSYILEAYWKTVLRPGGGSFIAESLGSNSGGITRFNVTNEDFFSNDGKHDLYMTIRNAGGDTRCFFANAQYSVQTGKFCKSVVISQTRNAGPNGDPIACHGGGGGCIDSQSPITVTAVIYKGANPYDNSIVRIHLSGDQDRLVSTDSNGMLTHTFNPAPPNPDLNFVIDEPGTFLNFEGCKTPIPIADHCDDSLPDQCQVNPPAGNAGDTTQRDAYKFCSQISDENLRDKCIQCTEVSDENADGHKDYKGVWTAIGCIKRDPEAIAQTLIMVGLSTGGGVSLLMGLAAGFILTVSQGDPKRTSDAKDMLTAAVTGLLFIIFSVTILQFIGYTVLKIPGFGG